MSQTSIAPVDIAQRNGSAGRVFATTRSWIQLRPALWYAVEKLDEHINRQVICGTVQLKWRPCFIRVDTPANLVSWGEVIRIFLDGKQLHLKANPAGSNYTAPDRPTARGRCCSRCSWEG